MKTTDKGSRRFLRPVVALLLLVGAVAAAMPSMPSLAGPPDPTTPEVEPFYARLEQPLTSQGVTGQPLALQTQIAADPLDWYNLMAEEFDQGSSLPATWTVTAWSGPEWEIHDEQSVSPPNSAGVTTTTSGRLNTWLFYGGDTGFPVQDVANAELIFNYWLDTEKDVVYFGWAASSDGQSFYGARTSGRVRGWLTGVLDMRQYIGDGSVWIAFFVVTADAQDAVGEQRIYLDNTRVRGKEPYYVHFPEMMKNHSTTFIFTDDFSNVSSGWPYVVKWGSADEKKRWVQGYTNKLMADYPADYDVIGGDCRKEDRYFMRVGSRDYGAKVIARAPVQAGSRFTLEADIAFCDTENFASAGLVFGLNDAHTQYYRVILIYDVGGSIKYAIWRDDSVILKNVSTSPHLEWKKGGFGRNTVKVVRDGCKIWVYFNDALAWSTTSECHYTDRRWVGFFHDRYPGTELTGATTDDFRLEGALQPDD
ncbi:MAG: hypothetical protein JSV36_04030 [Anaerolineae bacterium]|nr:MAG: hypothetical protein JSV36_04030 [Anaerolineae bacterium]